MCTKINKKNNNTRYSVLSILNEAIKGTNINNQEVILVVGTEQHSATYGNALMFPAQAVREVRENFSKIPAVTILMFTDGYTEMSLKIIERDAKIWNPKLNFKRINSTDELINYINNGDKNRDRNIFKIGIVKIFAHGYPLSLEFGLDGANAIKQKFGLSHTAKLKVSSFIPKATIYSYACRTGNSDITGVVEVVYDELDKLYYDKNTWRNIVKPQNSLAQKLADYLDARVYAYFTRSNYALTFTDDNDKSGYKKTRITIEDERVNATSKQTIKIIAGQTRNSWDEIIWNSKGALNPAKGGSKPLGLPKGIFRFEKGKMEIKAGV